MKLPRKVRVGTHAYKVTAGVAGHLAAVHSEDRGSTVCDDLSIVLDDRLPVSRQRTTLLHEVLHAAWDVTPLRVHDVAGSEELVVTALAEVMIEVLRRNRDLVDFLLDE